MARIPRAGPKRRLSIRGQKTSGRSDCFSVTPTARARCGTSALKSMTPAPLPDRSASEGVTRPACTRGGFAPEAGRAAFQHVNDHAVHPQLAGSFLYRNTRVRVENHRSDQNAESHNAHRIVLRPDRMYQGRGRRTVARGLPSRHAPAAGVRHPACASSPRPKNDGCSTIPNGCSR
jgi:hypothetical protein